MGFELDTTEATALDAEHQVQTGLVSALREAVAGQRPGAEVDEILDRLFSYTEAHFMAEQLLMRLKAYPHYEAHQLEHDQLMDKVRELERRYRAGEVPLTLAAADSLTDLLLNHTQGADSALTEFISKET